MVVLFSEYNIDYVPHFSPLHYLPFIARTRELLSKKELRSRNFKDTHFRSKSKNSDEDRGFVDYAFLTLSKDPGIVRAKLEGGFPHVVIAVPTSGFQDVSFDLCRYNVAMSRRLPTSPQGGFSESDTNGRYYEGKKLPVARTEIDQKAMLKAHYLKGTMIEVLVPQKLSLPDDTIIECFHENDLSLSRKILAECNCPWDLKLIDPPGRYNRDKVHVTSVEKFVEESLNDPDWRGDGLEFDRVGVGEGKR